MRACVITARQVLPAPCARNMLRQRPSLALTGLCSSSILPLFLFLAPRLPLRSSSANYVFSRLQLSSIANLPHRLPSREIVFRNWKLISRGRQILGGCNARLILGPRTRVEASNCFVIAKEKLAGLALFGGCDGESREFVLVLGISHGSVVLRRL